MTTWFTADLHLGHSRIIDYCSRPFKNYDEMEDVLLENFNSRIKRGDALYILGDVAWSSYKYPSSRFFNRLNSKQIHLILGNHDDKKVMERSRLFAWIGDYKNLHHNQTSLVLCHYPLRTWVGKGHGAYHLYGHVHGRMEGIGRSMDVGVDPLNYFPISAEEVVEKLSTQSYKPGEA